MKNYSSGGSAGVHLPNESLTGGFTLLSSYDLPGIPVQVHIHDTPTGRRYTLTEPILNQIEQDLYTSLTLSLKFQLKKPEIYHLFRQQFRKSLSSFICSSTPDLSSSSIEVLLYFLTRDMKGFGPLQPFLDDPSIVRISIKGIGTAAIIEHQQYGMMISGFIPDEREYHRIIRKAENRSGKRIEYATFPVILPIKQGLIQVYPPDSDKGPFELEFIRPKNNGNQTEKSLRSEDKIISVSHYLNGVAIGRLVDHNKGTYAFLAGFSGISEQEKKILWEIKKWDKITELEYLSFSSLKQQLQIYIDKSSPHINLNSRKKIISRFILEKNNALWVRLLLSDNKIRSIWCPGPGKKIRILHEKHPKPVFTNIKLSYHELDYLGLFFARAGGTKDIPEKGRVDFRFKEGFVVSIDRTPEKKDIKISIHSSRTGDCISPPSSDYGEQIGYPRVPGPKSEEILSKVFDLKEQKGTSQTDKDNSGIDNHNTTTSSNWKERLKNFSFQFPQAGFKRKKQKPDPHVKAPNPKEPQVKSVLDVQVPEGLIAEEAYWLINPHAYAVILKDPAGDRVYRVIEPDLTPRERIVLEETHETLRDVLIFDKPVSKGDLFLDFVEASKVIKTYDPHISDDRLSVLYYYLKRNLNGYGKIDPLMHDELLEDISCNGHHLPVYVHHRFYSSMPTSVLFDQEELNRFVLKLSQKADKQVSLTSPLLDAALPNGSRAQITYSDVVSTKGSSFTIRKFRSDPMTPITLLGFGTYDPDLLAFLWLSLENRKSLIVVGGTASGKTSAMNALSFFIPHNSKIVSLEDTRELQIPHRNWLPVQTRESAALNERGNINLFDLLKASLRQRPEYIIVGEVRGNEAQTLFQAMNSGHTTISTLHAGNVEEALNRLTNEPINVPPAMFGALDLMVIQTFHYRNGRMIRRCDAVHEIMLKEGDKVGWNTLYEYNPVSDGFDQKYDHSKTLETIKYMHNWTEQELQFQLRIRKEFLIRIKNQPRSDPVQLMQFITRLRRMA